MPLPRWTRKPRLGTPLVHSHTLTNQLEACWLFNEGQGTIAYDCSGNGHDILLGTTSTDVVNARWTGGNFRGPALQCLATTGVTTSTGNMRGNVSPLFTIPSGDTFSIEFWINKSSADLYGAILSVLGNRGVFVHNSGAGFLVDYYLPGDNQNSTVLSFDVWYHLVLTVANQGAAQQNARFYVNGKLDGSLTLSATDNGWNSALNDVNSESFVGTIDLMRVWRKRVLTPEEIGHLYRRPFDMFMTKRVRQVSTSANLTTTVTPAHLQWQTQTPTIPRFVNVTPARIQWQASLTGLPRDVTVTPAQLKWRANIPLRNPGAVSAALSPPTLMLYANELTAAMLVRVSVDAGAVALYANPFSVQFSVTVQPAKMQWKGATSQALTQIVLRDCGPIYDLALAQPFIAGDWLIQAPALGLKFAFAYNPDGTWDHRIVDLSDIEISVSPGGGLASVSNVTLRVAEDAAGQSIVQLWQQANAVGAVEVTIDFLLDGATTALRMFTGHIDTITLRDAVSEILIVDESIQKDVQLPRAIVTATDFPNADARALTQPLALVYGLSEIISTIPIALGAVPLLLVDTETNTYLVAGHAMSLGGSLAVFDQATYQFLALESLIPIHNNMSATITLGTYQTHAAVLESYSIGVTDPQNVADGNSASITLIGTQVSDGSGNGTGFINVTPGFLGQPNTPTIQITATNHRRSPGSDPTMTGQFVMRAINTSNAAALTSRILFTSPIYRHVTSAQTDIFVVSNVAIGGNEYCQVQLAALCEGTTSSTSQTYQVGEISIVPLLAFSATVSGVITAVALPVPMQEFRFNPQLHPLYLFAQYDSTLMSNAVDGFSTTYATVHAGFLDSNLDGYGMMTFVTAFNRAQRGNNTVVLDLMNHRRIIGSQPTVTGTFNLQTYNALTGTISRDNLFVTQAFRQNLTRLKTSFVTTGLNLGANEWLGVKLLARNEGGPGAVNDSYEVAEMALNSFHQPTGDSELFLYGNGYGGRYDPDGTITSYAGLGIGTILRQPDQVIASLLIQELGMQVDPVAFAFAYTFNNYGLRFDGGLGPGWAVQRDNSRTILDAAARQSTALLAPTFLGTWRLVPFLEDMPSAQSFAIDTILCTEGAERQRPEDRNSTMQITLGNMQTVYNRFEVHFGWNPGGKKFDRVWKVDENGSNLPVTAPDRPTIEGLCAQSFARYGPLPPLIIDAYWIADNYTAAYLLRHLVKYFSLQRLTLDFDTTLKAACLQVGDFITVTYPGIPVDDNGKTFEVHSIRYQPTKGRIHLVASRVATLNLGVNVVPVYMRWQAQAPIVNQNALVSPAQMQWQTASNVEIQAIAIEEPWEFDPVFAPVFQYAEEWSF